MARIPGRATSDGTRAYVSRFPEAREAHAFREVFGLQISSVGLGTYLGEVSKEKDAGYKEAAVAALGEGINVLDTAINYRHQRSERVLAETIREFIGNGGRREEVFVSTKGGYLPLDADVDDPHKKVQEDYIDSGLVTPENLVVDAHCMDAAYLKDQIERSRTNLGLETIDLYYLHNPETQLAQLAPEVFDERMRSAFVALEEAVEAGAIARYGLATWAGLRAPLEHKAHLSLERVIEIAGEAAGQVGRSEHSFKAVQAPLNLMMPEAVTANTQQVEGVEVPLTRAAERLGLAFFASASIMQGRLAEGLPLKLSQMIGAVGDAAQTALQATRSAPGVTTALVGMSQKRHVEAALEVLQVVPGASGVWPVSS
jgi:aryl-alcohol dehydrogenase-like predicted oxidoreductase